MDNSLTNFELTESTLKNGSDSEQGSDKNSDETIEELVFNNGSSTSDASLEEFDNNLPETVTLLSHKGTGSKVYLVGTAHFSKESQQDVAKVIQTVKPQIVVVELCKSRTNILAFDEETVLKEAQEIDFQKIVANIKANGVYNGIMYFLLLNTSAQITKQIGMAPGGEFRVAYKEAEKIPNCSVHLGDRPINITLKRALSRLTWFQTFKLAWHLLTNNENITVEDIEKCKQRDMLEQLLAELAGEYPAFREVFLDERDIFLTHSLQAAAVSKLSPQTQSVHLEAPIEPLRIVGVVGIGHVPGITRLWPVDQSSYLKAILTVPPPSFTSKAIKLSFRLSLLTFGSYMVYRYVPLPVPKSLVEYVHLGFQKMLTSVKTGTSDLSRFTIH